YDPEIAISRAVDKHPVLGAPLLHCRTVIADMQPNHQPPGPWLVAGEQAGKPLPLSRDIGKYLLDNLYRGPCSSTSQWTPGKGAPVLATLKLEAFPCEEGPHREPACNPLCKGDDIRFYPG